MFGKKKQENKLDKILMGVIVGGAIGSVLGVGLAPKKGSDTRKDVTKQANSVFHKAKNAFTGIAGLVTRPKKKTGKIDAKAATFAKSIPEEK